MSRFLIPNPPPFNPCQSVFKKHIFRVQISSRRISPIHHQITPRHPSRGIAQEIDAGVGNVVGVAKVKQIQGAVSISLLRAPPSLHRAGCAGYGRHGGEAPALCEGSDDVGLDSSVPSHQGEGTKTF